MNSFVENYKIVRLEKADLKVLRWVMRARSTDEHRPSLMAILVKGKETVACNGFAIHLSQSVKENPLPEGMWLVQSIQKDLVILEQIEGQFPDYKKVMNVGFKKVKYQGDGSWKAQIAINPFLLKDVLAMPAKGVRMTAGNGPLLFEAEYDSEGLYQLTGVVMPMHLGGASGGIDFIPAPPPEIKEAQPA